MGSHPRILRPTLALLLGLATATPAAAQDDPARDATAPDDDVTEAPGDDAAVPAEGATEASGDDGASAVPAEGGIEAPGDDGAAGGATEAQGHGLVLERAVVDAPAIRAEIADLEERLDAAEGRVSLFAALTIGGTTLMIGGVVAMVVVAAIPAMGCTPMVECVTPFEDFAAGMTLTIAGSALLIIGAILWGDADTTVRRLQGRLDSLRRDLEPTASVSRDGFRLGLRAAF